MPQSESVAPGPLLPAGFRAVPVHVANDDVPLRICAVLADKPAAGEGPLIRLRVTCDANVFLGCLGDRGGVIHEWLELWVQDVDGLAASLPAARNNFSNRALDERWQQQTHAIAKTGRTRLYQTGWEAKPHAPVLLDLAGQSAKTLADGNGAAWSPARSDDELKAAGLPAYADSLHRYLVRKDAGGAPVFLPVTTAAPANDKCVERKSVVPEGGAPVFNFAGGLQRVVPFAPFELGEFADLLGGKPWKGFPLGKQTLLLHGEYQGLDDWQKIQQSGHHLFLGQKGRAGCIVEAFHLKVQLLAAIIRVIRDTVYETQVPMLNIDATTFRVSLAEVGRMLPLFWTSAVSLAKTGDAFALPVSGTEAQYFIRPGATGESIFLPQGIHRFLEGTGTVRLRKVTEERGRGVVEGTLVIEDQSGFSPHDLFWLRLAVGQGRVDLYVHCYTEDGLAKGEVRFRSVEQMFGADAVAALKSAEGVAFPRTPYQMVPLLSTPCDLYSLGVLAARILLVNGDNTLPVALDSLLSLARQSGDGAGEGRPASERVRTLFSSDERFVKAIGAHRLVHEGLSPADAAAILPAELWHELLGILIRLFPGAAPDSFRRDFGDAPPGALETVFNEPLEALDALLVKTRSLIVIDWTTNREIRSVIDEIAAVATQK